PPVAGEGAVRRAPGAHAGHVPRSHEAAAGGAGGGGPAPLEAVGGVAADAGGRAVSEQVQQMFSAIAPRYDVANQVLSLGVHRRWRARAVALSGARPGHAVLDCATGTGDLAFALKRAVGPTGRVLGTDFCQEMLAEAP